MNCTAVQIRLQTQLLPLRDLDFTQTKPRDDNGQAKPMVQMISSGELCRAPWSRYIISESLLCFSFYRSS